MLFYFLFVFSMFYRYLEEKEAFMEILDLKDKSWEKLEFCQSDRAQGACNWAHQCSNAQDKEQRRVHKEDRLQCDRVHTAYDQTHLCVRTNSTATLFWKVLILGFLQLALNPTIFRVSRVPLDSINRLVNTKKHTCDFGEEFTTLKEANFRVLFFSFILFYVDN